MLGRDVVAVGRQPAEVGGALLAPAAATSRTRLGGIWTPTSGIRRAALGAPAGACRRASPESPTPAAARRPSRPASPSPSHHRPSAAGRPASAISATSLPVVARVRDEVLEDHLLDVAVPRVHRGERLERGDALLLGLADADQDPARERDRAARPPPRSSPAARAGCLVGEPACTVSIRRSETDSSISPIDAFTSRRRSRSSRAQHAEVRVRQHAALERPLAGPDHIGGEVLVAELAQALARPPG